MTLVSSPSLVTLPFLKKEENIQDILKYCTVKLEEWKEERLTPERKEHLKRMAVDSIWHTNVLEDTVPVNVTQREVISVLERVYSDEEDSGSEDSGNEMDDGRKDAGLVQMINHLKAFKFLLSHKEEHLTEVMVKGAHKVMMEGLSNEQGIPVKNGEYRQSSVHAGGHSFPSHECIPLAMKRIVKEYNERVSKPDHDPHVLAAWIHFEVVSLHPFDDGNGRTSRLLWCYSLMKDGLPFPPVLTSGHKKSQKHLVKCLQKDRDLLYSNHPHMTTLTVVSVFLAWKDFLVK